jgi:hypothetical protein
MDNYETQQREWDEAHPIRDNPLDRQLLGRHPRMARALKIYLYIGLANSILTILLMAANQAPLHEIVPAALLVIIAWPISCAFFFV